jgi:hypothetical protein
MARRRWYPLFLAAVVASSLIGLPGLAQAAVTREQVERAIKQGVLYLKHEQRADGSWRDSDQDALTGTSSLVTLALLTAGEPVNSPAIARSLAFLRTFTPGQLNSTYAVSLQTMVLAAADPKSDMIRIAGNVEWLTRAQIKSRDRMQWPGSWTYSAMKMRQGDNSNTQYALLGLQAASEAGVPVDPSVWALSRRYWEESQKADGSWAYHAADRMPGYGSMTAAGISSLVITGLKQFQGRERLEGSEIHNCGVGDTSTKFLRALQWMGTHFRVGENPERGLMWRYYFLYGMERAGRLSGQRFFGQHDWYREGAERLVHDQDQIQGCWRGVPMAENHELIATSFALLFLAKGRSPVLINKLRHGPKNDWNNDVDDVRNLVATVTRDWKPLLGNQVMTWQVVNPDLASVEDLLQAPIVFLNGHAVPELKPAGEKALRDYVEQGGFIFAEACCGKREFDEGFRALMKKIFPEEEYQLHVLSPDHAVWRSRHLLSPDIHPLLGIEHGCRTVVIYSPEDLSCYWNQAETSAANPSVIKALRVGQNVVDYATGRELPADKLAVREIRKFQPEVPRRGALRIAKVRHAGDWNVAPLAIPNLTIWMRDKLGLDVVAAQKELLPGDTAIANYPLVYIHGRASFTFQGDQVVWLRHHLDPSGGTLFADAACGSAAFDASFRKLIADLLPGRQLEPIPNGDELYSKRVGGYDLSDVQYTRGAGGGRNFPQLEGVKIDGHWAVIYSKYDLGCALERHAGPDCKGYTTESALRIATNIVLYSMLE